MKRNKNIDVFRAVSLLAIIVYHSWVLAGSQPFKSSYLTLIVSLSGEMGVTAFFALSGFGIFYSLKKSEEEKTFSIRNYISNRVRRIVPHYYISLLIDLTLLGGASYLSREGIKHIVTHLLFIHNLFPECHGSINGVLWTMGVIVQFYIIAPFLYKGFKRMGVWMELLCIIFTIGIKSYVYAVILPLIGWNNQFEFIAGRQLFTALDNFTIGMFVAYVVTNKEKIVKQFYSWSILFGSIIGLILTCKLGQKFGIHTNNYSGYIWHSCIAIGIGGIMYSIYYINSHEKNILYRFLLWISKYEYGIYIWHLLIITNLISNSPWIQKLLMSSYLRCSYIIFAVISVLVGVMFSKMVTGRGR